MTTAYDRAAEVGARVTKQRDRNHCPACRRPYELPARTRVLELRDEQVRRLEGFGLARAEGNGHDIERLTLYAPEGDVLYRVTGRKWELMRTTFQRVDPTPEPPARFRDRLRAWTGRR